MRWWCSPQLTRAFYSRLHIRIFVIIVRYERRMVSTAWSTDICAIGKVPWMQAFLPDLVIYHRFEPSGSWKLTVSTTYTPSHDPAGNKQASRAPESSPLHDDPLVSLNQSGIATSPTASLHLSMLHRSSLPACNLASSRRRIRSSGSSTSIRPV